jgi:hypothetical protein
VPDPVDFNFRFQLSLGEFRKAHQTHLRQSLFTIKNLVLLTTALGIGSIQAQMFGGADWALRIFVGLWCLVLAFMAWAYLYLPERLYRKSERHSSEQRIQTEDDGLTLEQGGIKNFLEWGEISRVSESDGSVLLHRKHHIPILIPARAFSSAEERASFHERVERARMDA